MMPKARGSRVRGGPLGMLVLLLGGWSAARAVWWENPFAALAPALDLPLELAVADMSAVPAVPAVPAVIADTPVSVPLTDAGPAAAPLTLPLLALGWRTGARRAAGRDPRLAAAHHLLWVTALREFAARASPVASASGADASLDASPWQPPAPFLPAPQATDTLASAGRWSVDGWAFWRQGSDAAPISQGRVPIYGASQAGAVLQYRLAPAAQRDPRLYARAYRALVRRGESELAVGVSARPVGRVPLRAAAEVRYTGASFSDIFRPAAYVVTELAPAALPYGAQLEAYGQAGWVGGPDPTGFADGQASITGEVRPVAALSGNTLRLSLGAAAWGGAQKDAQRIDIGPTLRLDLTVGEVPARISVDWRERVGGDAGPDSGLAATLSTRF